MSCTPPASSDLDWEVMNNTGDTLTLITYVPLDSVLVKPTALDSLRGRIATDTFLSGQPSSVLITHRGQWYWVSADGTAAFIPALHDNAQAYNPTTGGVSYQLLPHATRVVGQITMGGPYEVSYGPPFNRLTLAQGSARRTLTGQEQLIQSFRQAQARQEKPHASHYRYRLIVESGLAIKQ